VLEHVADPRALAAAMAACLRPGGLLVLSMPIWPSPHTEMPNNLVNLPPHHLTWWTEGACRALCAALGLEPLRVGPLPTYPLQAPLHWSLRLCPARAARRLAAAELALAPLGRGGAGGGEPHGAAVRPAARGAAGGRAAGRARAAAGMTARARGALTGGRP
jgi:SAM-dependent methyltransferase